MTGPSSIPSDWGHYGPDPRTPMVLDANNNARPVGKSIDASSMPINTVQQVIREDFSSTTLSSFWQTPTIGSGHSIDLSAASALSINTGVTPSTETVLRSVKSFRAPFRVMFVAMQPFLSQRIINQEFELRVVSADGTAYAGWMFDGTSATTAKTLAQLDNTTMGDSSVTSTHTLTSAGISEIELFSDEIYFHTRLSDSGAIRSNSYVRNRRVPDPTVPLFIEIRVRNLATAPASTTTMSLDAILIQDISEITAEITSGRGGGATSQSIPVSLTNSNVTLVTQPGAQSNNTQGISNRFKLTSAATTNFTVIKNSTGRLYFAHIQNTSATGRYVKFYNKTTTPTSTDTPVETYYIPPNSFQRLDWSDFGNAFATGIGVGITANVADNDATAVAAGDIVMTAHYQ